MTEPSAGSAGPHWEVPVPGRADAGGASAAGAPAGGAPAAGPSEASAGVVAEAGTTSVAVPEVSSGPAAPSAGSAVRTLATGLIAYGVIGLIVAVIGVGVLVLVNGSLTSMRDQLDTQIVTASQTIDSASRALTEAANTSTSAATTLESTSKALGQLGGATTSLATAFRNLQQTTGSVSILGLTPLASVSSFFGDAASQLEAASGQIGSVGTSLQGNQEALSRASAAATDLSSSMTGLRTSLQSGAIQSSLDQLRFAIDAALVLIILYFVVPAVGALILGIRLRGSPA